MEMLLSKHLRRHHERRGKSGSMGIVYQSRCNERLAAADITLQQPVHHLPGAHIRHAFFYGALLRICRLKGESREEIIYAVIFDDYSVLLLYAVLPQAEGAGEQEKLFKNQPSASKLKAACICRKVDVSVGEARLNEFIP